jgi:hypothetical protein
LVQEEKMRVERRRKNKRDIWESLREPNPNPTLFVRRFGLRLQPVGADEDEGEAPAGKDQQEVRKLKVEGEAVEKEEKRTPVKIVGDE